MVRNVRNFWCDADVLGRNPVGFGPVGSDGWMTLTIYQRKDGEVSHAYTIYCYALGAQLAIEVVDSDGVHVSENRTER